MPCLTGVIVQLGVNTMLVERARIGLARIAMVLADVEEFDGIVTDIVERLIIDDDLEEA
jgi:hypothetical protein